LESLLDHTDMNEIEECIKKKNAVEASKLMRKILLNK
jgi:hypothetical protein